MGVHTTFVRSVDLDEWTQRQIDAMKLGGNANAREYFRKHGLTDQHTKIEKKYKSKAAQSYRKVLAELVQAEAVKRGEAVPEANGAAASENGSSNNPLMDSLHAADQREAAANAAAASKQQSAESKVTVAKGIQASQMHAGKGKLLTPPSSGNAPKIVLRKPSSGSSLGFKKKPAGGKKTTLRVNKLPSNASSSLSNDNNDGSDDGMEDIEATMQKAKDAEAEETEAAAVATAAQKQAQEAEQARLLAARLEQEATIAAPAAPAPAPSPKAAPVAPKQTMADSLAKMKSDNSDFFGGL